MEPVGASSNNLKMNQLLLANWSINSNIETKSSKFFQLTFAMMSKSNLLEM